MSEPDDGLFITRAELEYLTAKLKLVDHLVMEMAIALSGDAVIEGSAGRSAPRSKAPYPIHLEALLGELTNELGTTIRDICETRCLPYEGGQGVSSMSAWLVRYRYALAMSPQAPELFDGLVRIIDRCLRAMNQLEYEHMISQNRIDAANRQVVTGPQMEKLARKLGDQGKGLTERRVKHLRDRGLLSGTKDGDTWFYHLGDILAAHERARATRARPKLGA